jgi:hypothetical protein
MSPLHAQLHVTSGDAAASGLKRALGLDEAAVLVHRDVLSCGPLPRFVSVPTWRDARYGFWQGATDGRINPPASQDLLWQADDLREAGEIWLWLGTALSDQLLGALMVQLFDHLGVDLARLRTVQLEGVLGVGLLTAEQVRDHPAATTMTAPQIEQAREAWRAVTANAPDRLLTFLTDPNPPASPLLQMAMHHLIDRFPDRATGLSRWDQALLAACGISSRAARAIVVAAMTSRRGCLDIMGDSYLFARLRRLGDPGLAAPVVSFAGDVFDQLGCQVTLTGVGVAVQAGQASFLELNPTAAATDDWIGGMQLAPRQGQLWFRDDQGGITA